MKTKDVLLFGGLALAGFAAYKMLTPPAPPPGYYGANYLPPGGTYNGWYNGSGAPVWLTATGMAVNALGQILNSVPWGSILGGGSNSGGGNALPADYYEGYSPGGV